MSEQESLSAFHVIGFEDADELQMKSDVMIRIKKTLRERNITTQEPAAEALGMNRSEVSQLLGGKVSRFTLDRLVKALNQLDKRTQVGIVFSVRTSAS